MRLVFAGTPEPALPSLERLLGSRHDVVAVVTRPPARAGRGRALRDSPVAELAAAHGVEVLTPWRPSEPEFADRLAALAPDCCPVVAYGALLPASILDVPRHGWVNLHFSVLPAWRGAAPVQHAIRAGDDVTGATTFRIVEELDAGPVFGVVTDTIRPRDTSGDVLGRLADVGAELLVQTLDALESGLLKAVPQPADGISYAPKVTSADAKIDWTAPAAAIDRLVRSCTPEPGAWTTLGAARVGVGPVTPVMSPDRLPAGELVVTAHRVLVGTGTGAVELGTVQPPGKRPMPAADWARGARLEPGTAFA